jgi:hypothetical protein
MTNPTALAGFTNIILVTILSSTAHKAYIEFGLSLLCIGRGCCKAMRREGDYMRDLCLGLHSIVYAFLGGRKRSERSSVARFGIRRSTARKRVESKTLPNSTFSVFRFPFPAPINQ